MEQNASLGMEFLVPLILFSQTSFLAPNQLQKNISYVPKISLVNKTSCKKKQTNKKKKQLLCCQFTIQTPLYTFSANFTIENISLVIFLLLSTNPMCRLKTTLNVSTNKSCVSHSRMSPELLSTNF